MDVLHAFLSSSIFKRHIHFEVLYTTAAGQMFSHQPETEKHGHFFYNYVNVFVFYPRFYSELGSVEKLTSEHHSPSRIQSLKEVILEEWKKIDLAKCCQLVHSMPRRLGAVIKNHGGHTKY